MDGFSITREQNKGVTIVHIHGRVDSSTTAALDSELTKISKEASKFVLDFKDVEYLSSAGVRSILKIMKEAGKTGGSVRLASTPTNVMSVLETVGFIGMLKTFSTVEEALKNF